MRLDELVGGFGEIRGRADHDIADVCYDSREVIPGSLFFCVDGTREDGHQYAGQALDRGAVALVVTRWLDDPATQIRVADIREAMAGMGARFFEYPAQRIKMIGVTGTKGKTSATYLIEGIGRAWGKRVGLIGTIESRLGEDARPAKLTTPNALDLHRMLKEMADRGADWVVMEVAAHGISYKRIAGILFDVAVFTNLSRDHLDDYGTMEAYFEAKRQLFTPLYCKGAVVNADDPAAGRLAHQVPTLTYGIEDGVLRGGEIQPRGMGGSEFVLFHEGEKQAVSIALPGRFSVYNALAAAGVARMLGVPLEVIGQGMRDIQVPGRCEVVGNRRGATILRDYAHSPDSVGQVLAMLKALTPGRILTVVGCGGNRDKGKRPIMGRIAGEGSDLTVITSDNPRREDPEDILDQVEAGIRPTGKPFVRIENRRQAIRRAIGEAGPGDVVLIAGKGHESYQEIQGVRHPFDEKTVVAEILEEMEGKA